MTTQDPKTHELIANRWSPRSFDAEHKLSVEQVHSLFEAARWAASCFNGQPWRYVYALRQDKAEFDRLLQCLAETNRNWAFRASMLVVGGYQERFEHNDKPNAWAQHDLGLANAQVMLQATAMRLHVHAMAGFDADKAKADLGFPDGCQPKVAIAIGRIASPEQLDETLRKRETAVRERKALDAILYRGRFGA